MSRSDRIPLTPARENKHIPKHMEVNMKPKGVSGAQGQVCLFLLTALLGFQHGRFLSIFAGDDNTLGTSKKATVLGLPLL